MCCCFTPNRICTFSLDNGDLQNWLLIFLCRVDGVRKMPRFTAKLQPASQPPPSKKKVEVVKDSVDKKSYNNNIGKPWKSSKILRLKTKTLGIFEDFAFVFACFFIYVHFYSLFIFFHHVSFFFFILSFFIFSIFHFSICFFFHLLFSLFFFFFFFFILQLQKLGARQRTRFPER